MRSPFHTIATAFALSIALSLSGTVMAEEGAGGEAAVQVPAPLASCVGCHLPDEHGALSRIRDQRKTAEGWEMTINRMRLIHGLTLSGQEIDIAPASMRELVKYLADNQGLAPSESAPYRYLLEQDLNQVESAFDQGMVEMCGRCHSSARFALQRRTEDEWEKLVHFHLGQYPSTEYSLYGRDRDWFDQALNESVPALAEQYPLETDAWQEWQAAPKPQLAGRWVVAGHMAGKGDLHAVMTVEGGEGGDPHAYRVATPMYREANQRYSEKQLEIAYWRNRHSIALGQEYGDPDADLGPVMVFLASDASRFITGQLIPVDGGQTNVR